MKVHFKYICDFCNKKSKIIKVDYYCINNLTFKYYIPKNWSSDISKHDGRDILKCRKCKNG